MAGKCAATSSFTLCAPATAPTGTGWLRRVTDRPSPTPAPPPPPGSVTAIVVEGHRTFGCGRKR